MSDIGIAGYWPAQLTSPPTGLEYYAEAYERWRETEQRRYAVAYDEENRRCGTLYERPDGSAVYVPYGDGAPRHAMASFDAEMESASDE